MNKIIRKLLLWAFKGRLKVYAIQEYVADIEMVKDRLSYEGYIKRRIGEELARNLFEDGVIEIDCNYIPEQIGRKYTARIYVLK